MHTETWHMIIGVLILITSTITAIATLIILRVVSGIFSNTSDGGVVIKGPGPKKGIVVYLAEKE